MLPRITHQERITHEDLFGREGAGHYGSNIGFPTGNNGSKNMKLALAIADGTFFGWNKLPLELQNLRERVITPYCNILNTPEQK